MATDLSARKLLLEVRNDFNSCVDADSLMAVFEMHQMLKKKDKKFLRRPDADEHTKNTLLFHKMYNSEETSSPLSATEVIRLLEETKNERNILFSKTLQSILSTMAKATTSSLPPFKYHYPLNDNPSATFSSTGGVLYSPVYGVTAYIPDGAILGEEQVEVSFRVVTEETEIREVLLHSLFEGSLLCSPVFELEAKLVDAMDGVEFAEFRSDVWIELPHCLSFRSSTAFVVSESRGKVEVETQAVFSEGYPYVNLPVRHFSRFFVVYSPKKRFEPKFSVRKAKPKLSTSNSLEKYSANCNPHTLSKQLKEVAQASATSPSAAEKRALYFEMKKTSSEASAEEQHQTLIRQDASANLCDDDAMEVDQPAPVSTASNASLQQEDLNVESMHMAIMAQIYQPRERNKLQWWTADIVFAPHLHNTYKTLADFQEQTRYECCSSTSVFHLELQTQLIQLKSGPSTPGWSVELSVTKILLEHFKTVAPLLGTDSKYSSKMADFLPVSTATVQNCGALLPLRHPVEVERSHPLTCCYLTCDPVSGEESCGIQLKEGPNSSSSAPGHNPSGSPQDPSPSSSTQDSSHSSSPQNPRSAGSPQDPSPSGSPEDPRSSGSTQDPRSSCSTQHPRSSGSPQDPRSSGSPQDPRSSGSPQDPRSSGSPQDPRSSSSPKAPRSSGFPKDPRSSGSTQDPRSSGSTLGFSCSGPTPMGPTLGYPSAPFQHTIIQWDRDRYVLALFSILIPEGLLATLGEFLGLPHLMIEQVMLSYTAGSTVNVGERAYEMFRRASSRIEQPLKFGRIFLSLNEIDRCNELVPILRSYVQSFKMATLAEDNGSISNCFLVWLRENHPSLVNLSGIKENRIILSANSEQGCLFRHLSPKLVCVWRMVGRLLGLTDSDIAAIDKAHSSQLDRESEPCYQMLIKWVSLDQSDITYYKLMAALQLTSRGTGAANDAIFYLNNFVLNLASAEN